MPIFPTTPSTSPTEPAEPEQVVREVELPAPTDVVWAVLTDPDELAEWLGRDVELDLEPGAVGRVTEDDGTVRQVLVTDVEPGHRLTWHWWSDDDELSSVELIVEPIDDDRSLVRVTETLTADVEPTLIDGYSALLGGDAAGGFGAGSGGPATGPIAPQASVRPLALAGV